MLEEGISMAASKTPKTIAEVLERIDQALKGIEKTIGGLSEKQISAPSTPTDWSIKDHIVHLSMWAKGIVALLKQQPRYEAMGLDRAFVEAANDADEMNDVIYKQHQDRAWDDIKAEFYAVHQSVVDVLKSMTDADLQKPYTAFEPGSSADYEHPIIAWIEGNTYDHYEEHIPWMEARIERDRAAGY